MKLILNYKNNKTIEIDLISVAQPPDLLLFPLKEFQIN